MFFMTACVQVSYVPLLGSGNQFNVVCLASEGCSAAVQTAHEGSGPSTVCCDDFGLECAQPWAFWGAVIGLCVGPMVPVPFVLCWISGVMKMAEESEALLDKSPNDAGR